LTVFGEALDGVLMCACIYVHVVPMIY